MAAGTILSRATGFVRAAVIAATLGVALTADIFNIANGIPTTLYTLVMGGVLNAVLVPQLVRTMRHDADGGEAYAQRLASAVIIVLLAASVVLVLAAPWVVRLFLDPRFLTPALAPQFDAAVAFTRWCLPQVFFYGVYTLLGQMLVARHRFGPMMFAPILNNLVAIAVFGGYLVVYGPLDPFAGQYSAGQVVWFGLGSTIGIAVQALVLVPVLRRSGLHSRLRTDLRGVGLGKAARLGAWTVGLIAVLQVTNILVTRLATSAVVGGEAGAGFSVYTNAFLVVMVPHSVITVSLASAMMPTMSAAVADGRTGDARAELVQALRLSLAVVVPAAGLLVGLAAPLMAVLFGHGAAADGVDLLAVTMAAFAPGLLGLTVHFLLQRGLYAFEDTRTPVGIQVVIGIVQVGLAWLLLRGIGDQEAAVVLAACWSIAYLLGAVISVPVIGRRLGGLPLGSLGLLLLRACVVALVAGMVALVTPFALAELGFTNRLLVLLIAGGIAGAAVLGAAAVLRLRELTGLLEPGLRRLRRAPQRRPNG
jgi:putative peptidoglycan lipid II flippase